MTRDESADAATPPGAEADGPDDPAAAGVEGGDAAAGTRTVPGRESGTRARVEEALRRRNPAGTAKPESDRERARVSGVHPPPGASQAKHWSGTIRQRVADGGPEAAAQAGPAAGDEAAAGVSSSMSVAEIRERVERRLKETEERRSTRAPSPESGGTPVPASPGRDRVAAPRTPQPPLETVEVTDWSAGWVGDEEETAPRSAASPATSPSRLAAFIATCAYLGRIRLAPGTIGAAAGLGAFVLTRGLPGMVSLGLFVIAVLVATWAAARHAEDIRHPDPPSVVVDEFCGMWLALVGTNPSFLVAGIAFVAFRFLDIAKPPPIRQLEKLPGGLGIMADDLLAGGIVRVGILLTLGM